MPHAIAFDTLAFSKKLKAAGVPEKQAEIQAEAMAELVEERLATKQDIMLLQRDIKELDVSLRHEIKAMEMRITIRLGGMMVVAIGVVATLVKLL